MDPSQPSSIGGSAMKAMLLTDADIASMSNQSCAAMDQKSQIAPANDRYTTHLNEVVKAMPVSANAMIGAMTASGTIVRTSNEARARSNRPPL